MNASYAVETLTWVESSCWLVVQGFVGILKNCQYSLLLESGKSGLFSLTYIMLYRMKIVILEVTSDGNDLYLRKMKL